MLDHESEITLNLRVESNPRFEGSSRANPITVIDIIREYWGNSNGYARVYCTLLLLRRMRFRYD